MSLIDAIGYFGVGLVFVTFSMKTMIPLRVVGIASNVVLIGYSFSAAVYPVLVLHLVLLPLNTYRLFEMMRLIRKVRGATAGDLSLDWLKPFTTRRQLKAGEILFRKGDKAEELFFVVSGRFSLRESRIEIPIGTVVGELGLLAPDRTRTQTLECVESGSVLRIGYDKILELYYQNPKFGFYFLRLASARLFENIARLEHRLEAPAL